MAVQKITNGLLYGLSTDTKPTNYAVNTLFYEFDTGDIIKYTSSGWKNFISNSINGRRRRGATNNRWYIGGQANAIALTTLTLSTNTFYATPLVVEGKRTVENIAMNFSTSVASSAARLGIYTDDGQNYPASLIAESTSTVSGTSINFGQSAIANATLEPGLYWLAANTTAAPVVRAVPVAGAFPINGTDSTAATTTMGVGWSVSRTYAALPSTFTASANIMTGNIPAIYVRFT